MKDIAHRGCIKGFVYRFMYVLVREKMASTVIRHPNYIPFLMDFRTCIL